MEKNKLIHNINSKISSLIQAMDILSNELTDSETKNKISILCKDRLDSLNSDWQEAKKSLKKKV